MTYSIVARDPVTGHMGVAVQSHFFSVGSIVTWAEAGVGAVATQSFAEPSYGPLGLDLMRAGRSAADALRALTLIDEDEARRQVAMVDGEGTTSAHTDALCIPETNDIQGEQVSCQANMMRNDTVWTAMLTAYTKTEGDLADKMIGALEAAEDEGGDIRGRQSAAILIVGAEATGRLWEDRILELRVEDHADPVTELKRLVRMRRGYDAIDEAERIALAGDAAAAAERFDAARAMIAPNVEASFWAGLFLAKTGDVEQAREALAPALRAHDGWAELLRRMPKAGLLPDDPDLIARLLEG